MLRTYPYSFTYIFQSIWQYRTLILRMSKREVVGRYRGSMLGLLWSFFNPVILLAVYTFFFSVVFKARFGTLPASKTEFAVILFSGLIIYNFFAECLNKAPGLILYNVNYVKKVVFPLEILPWPTLIAALFHAVISLFVLLGFFLYLNHDIPLTIFYFPIIFFPFIFLTLGVMWMLSAVSVFVRDIGQVIGMFTTVLLFLSPIFYSLDSIPAAYRNYFYLNPLTFIVDQSRAVMLNGIQPHWGIWSIYTLGSLLFAWLGLFVFQKARKAFGDVL